jgi:transposase
MGKIKLREGEVEYLNEFIRKGRKSARALTRARIMLLVHKGEKEVAIAGMLGVSRATVSNIKRRYREEGLEGALNEKPRPGQPRKYTEKHEAEIIAMACTSPPEGGKRWTIRLLMEEARKKPGFKTINRESIRLVLKKAGLSLG